MKLGYCIRHTEWDLMLMQRALLNKQWDDYLERKRNERFISLTIAAKKKENSGEKGSRVFRPMWGEDRATLTALWPEFMGARLRHTGCIYKGGWWEVGGLVTQRSLLYPLSKHMGSSRGFTSDPACCLPFHPGKTATLPSCLGPWHPRMQLNFLDPDPQPGPLPANTHIWGVVGGWKSPLCLHLFVLLPFKYTKTTSVTTTKKTTLKKKSWGSVAVA